MAQFKKRSSLISAVSTGTVPAHFFASRSCPRVTRTVADQTEISGTVLYVVGQPHSQVLRSFIFYVD